MLELDNAGSEHEHVWAFYERQVAPEIPWWKAAKAITSGEPFDEFLTLPWWSTERQSDGGLWGDHHNERRLCKLTRARPAGVTEEGEPWHAGLLYPGVPDECMQQPVGVITRKGHIGCLAPSASMGGIDKLVRTSSHGFSYLCVPVFVNETTARVPLPYGPDVSAFDDPWAAAGPGEGEDRAPTPWRINRSHIMAIHLAKHGSSRAWMRLANSLARLTEEHGVTVLEPLSLKSGSRVVNDVRGEAGAEFVDRICSHVHFTTERHVTDETYAVVTRYLHSTSRACQAARAAGIPIYRADGFGGRVAEALRLSHSGSTVDGGRDGSASLLQK